MDHQDSDFSTQKITPQLISQIVDALKNKAFGSVEIYIQNHTVTQITERTITKVAKFRSFPKKTLIKRRRPNHVLEQGHLENT